MTLSVRERLITAIQTALSGMAVPGLTVSGGAVAVHRARRKDVPEKDLPAILLDCKPSSSVQKSAGHVANVERVAIEGQVKAASDLDLDRALVALGAAVQQLVERDPTWGGLAIDSVLAEADQAAADGPGVGPLGGVLAVYLVEYWTRPGDPFALAP